MKTILLALAMLAIPSAAYLAGSKALKHWSRYKEAAPADQTPLFERFHYGVEDVKLYWQAFGENLGRERLFLELDLIFPFLYGGGLAAGLLLAWATLGRPFHPVWVLAPVVFIVLADWTENLTQLGQLARYESGGAAALQNCGIRVASLATDLKLLGIGGTAALLVILVFWVLVRAFRAG